MQASHFREPSLVNYRLAFLFLLAASPAYAVDPTAFLKRYESCSSELSPRQLHDAQKELLEGAMGMRAAATDPKIRVQLEQFCTDRFEQMKKSSDIKDCMSKP
jgi:hypothetical protein